MRHTLPAAVAATGLAVLVLVGCSSSPSESDKRYADAVAAADPDDFGGIPTDKLAGTLGSEGRDLCDQLKAGSAASALSYARKGFSDRESAALLSAAVAVYCPDQKGKLSHA
ncbi:MULTISPECIES: DUF732 domain-containing protein [Streptomyces]|uniref:DUF732 domain-containing protein n=1 Tax=Streptomyces doudnae TaxID=3075536 RepID=A0ABD5ELR9_9ACTN|nr:MULTISPECIES: DUF732 domain-containing protein [unclassified Streptomyces]MDT0435632.1 DUF732 domain-containing protein [Streptomyces sp. DSM 41981]MYQ62586.1 DUF732 domain-containing protein [Streptomyces sp. SID4950]SCD40365.1 Protein of unknown function [Streptomyces sp. SolWspMP-5a-2]